MYKKFFKRLIDIIISFCGLVILSPMFLIVAILVKIKLGSPIIFKQERVGFKGKIFTIYKFRTMLDKSDKNGKPLSDEKRMTKFGNFLRATSLDEIPELFNILKGEMSFVGPRPLLVEYMNFYTENQLHRHDAKPGLTGLAQINGRNDTTWEKRFEYDLKYIQNITFHEDLRIFLNTFAKVFKKEGICQSENITMKAFDEEENLKTPYFIVSEAELLKNIDCFKEALNEIWKNYKIAYSVKTNSLPWIIKYMNSKNILAEVVSDEEYELAKICGYFPENIIFNGPIKSNKKLEEAIKSKALVNIDSYNDIEFIKNNKPEIKGELGIRVNINTSIFNPKDIDYKEDGFRFGFSYENGELEKILNELKEIYPDKSFGLHVHVNSITRSVEAYRSLAKYTAEIIKKYDIKPSFIDIGGGFFGGVPGKPTAKDYILAIKEELKDIVNIDEVTLIVEPGSAFVGSAFDFCTSVIDVKDTSFSRIVTTDGSRVNIDPLWAKSKFLYSLEDEFTNELKETNVIKKQIICGYTCMDHDRIMILENEKELKKKDKIVYHKVGNYTVTMGGMFIKTLPDVYVKTIEEKIEKIRGRISIQDYYDIQSFNKIQK